MLDINFVRNNNDTVKPKAEAKGVSADKIKFPGDATSDALL